MTPISPKSSTTRKISGALRFTRASLTVSFPLDADTSRRPRPSNRNVLRADGEAELRHLFPQLTGAVWTPPAGAAAFKRRIVDEHPGLAPGCAARGITGVGLGLARISARRHLESGHRASQKFYYDGFGHCRTSVAMMVRGSQSSDRLRASPLFTRLSYISAAASEVCARIAGQPASQ